MTLLSLFPPSIAVGLEAWTVYANRQLNVQSRRAPQKFLVFERHSRFLDCCYCRGDLMVDAQNPSACCTQCNTGRVCLRRYDSVRMVWRHRRSSQLLAKLEVLSVIVSSAGTMGCSSVELHGGRPPKALAEVNEHTFELNR